MKKARFTRKNFIVLSIVYFYLLVCFVAALCIDATNPFMKANNPIQQLGTSFGFPLINGSPQSYLMLACFLAYGLILSAALIFEGRLAIYYDNRLFTKKWTSIYVGTILGLLALAAGIGYASQYPYDPELVENSFLFLLEALVVGLLLSLLLGSFVFALVSLIVNFKHIDEPIRAFNNDEDVEVAKQQAQADEELHDEQGNLAQSFGDAPAGGIANGVAGAGVGTGTGAGGEGGLDVSSSLKAKEGVFPGLCLLDYKYETYRDDEISDPITLKELVTRFRNYLAKQEGIYFEEKTLRAFIAGLATSRLIILEGLSGTGKSSLARYFSEFIGEKSFFEPVQATWRDRSSVLGFYNDFSRSYNETEFLKRLYEANYTSNRVNIMVLDELNISRIEYYFADFLSILEYPIDEWKLKIMQLPFDFEAPNKLQNGILQIAPNTYFIGTANKDDSTFTITDKVYDRAITIAFDDRNEPFTVEGEADPISLTYEGMQDLFKQAIETKEFGLNEADLLRFKSLTSFTYDTFDITFGNRIMHQIETLVPVYVAAGGSKEDALDFMFSRKVLSKLDGRFEDYIKKGLLDLRSLLDKTYGGQEFPLTRHSIERLLRKL